MSDTSRFRKFMESEAADNARRLNDRLHSATSELFCPNCGLVLAHPLQKHICKRDAVARA